MSFQEMWHSLPSADKKERLRLYDRISKYMAEKTRQTPSPECYENEPISITLLEQDLKNSSPEKQMVILNAAGQLLMNNRPGLFTSPQKKKIIAALSAVLKNKNPQVCSKVFWCLSRIDLSDAEQKNFSDFIESLEMMCMNNRNVVLTHEACCFLRKLLKDHTAEVEKDIATSSKYIIFPVCHPAAKIREIAHGTFLLALPLLMKHQSKVFPNVSKALKSTFQKDMLHLFDQKQEKYVLEIWCHVVNILGKDLHTGASVLNALMEVIEKGFKSNSEDTLKESYNAWSSIIQNFSLNLDVLSNPKRLQLLLRPLKLNMRKYENIYPVVCTTFWQLIVNLKERLSKNFEQAAIPILEFTVSSSLKEGSEAHTLSPCIRQTAEIKSTYLRKTACKMIISILDSGKSQPSNLAMKVSHSAIEPLDVPVQNLVLLSHFKALVKASKIIIRDLGNDEEMELELEILLQLLIKKISFDSNDANKDIVDAVSSLLTLAAEMVEQQLCSPSLCLKTLDNLSKLPQCMLISHYYHLGNLDAIHQNNLSVSLMTLLLKPYVLSVGKTDFIYLDAFKRLASASISGTLSPLMYAQNFLSMIDAKHIECVGDKLHMWSSIASSLVDAIKKTQEVNQGDSLENDFTCMYAALTFPVTHFMPPKVPQLVFRSSMKLWIQLYKLFIRFSSLIPSVEENSICEDFCQKLKAVIKDESLMEEDNFESLCQMLQTIIESTNFKVQEASVQKNESKLMKGALLRNRGKPLGNLTSLVTITTDFITVFAKKFSQEFDGAEKETKENLKTKSAKLAKYTVCLDLAKLIASNLSNSILIPQLFLLYADPISKIITLSYEKKLGAQFNLKLENLWNALTTSVLEQYKGAYDAEFLSILSPLFEAALIHPRKGIQDKARQLWCKTFGCQESLQDYPAPLKKVLLKSKLILNIATPSDIVIDEAALTGSFNETLDAFEVVQIPFRSTFAAAAGVCSPAINSENAKLRTPISLKKKQMPSRENINDLPDEEFVRIEPEGNMSPITPKRRVRTRKSFLPAMYNELSQNSELTSMSQTSEGSLSCSVSHQEEKDVFKEDILVHNSISCDKTPNMKKCNENSSVEMPSGNVSKEESSHDTSFKKEEIIMIPESDSEGSATISEKKKRRSKLIHDQTPSKIPHDTDSQSCKDKLDCFVNDVKQISFIGQSVFKKINSVEEIMVSDSNDIIPSSQNSDDSSRSPNKRLSRLSRSFKKLFGNDIESSPTKVASKAQSLQKMDTNLTCKENFEESSSIKIKADFDSLKNEESDVVQDKNVNSNSKLGFDTDSQESDSKVNADIANIINGLFGGSSDESDNVCKIEQAIKQESDNFERNDIAIEETPAVCSSELICKNEYTGNETKSEEMYEKEFEENSKKDNESYSNEAENSKCELIKSENEMGDAIVAKTKRARKSMPSKKANLHMVKLSRKSLSALKKSPHFSSLSLSENYVVSKELSPAKISLLKNDVEAVQFSSLPVIQTAKDVSTLADDECCMETQENVTDELSIVKNDMNNIPTYSETNPSKTDVCQSGSLGSTSPVLVSDIKQITISPKKKRKSYSIHKESKCMETLRHSLPNLRKRRASFLQNITSHDGLSNKNAEISLYNVTLKQGDYNLQDNEIANIKNQEIITSSCKSVENNDSPLQELPSSSALNSCDQDYSNITENKGCLKNIGSDTELVQHISKKRKSVRLSIKNQSLSKEESTTQFSGSSSKRRNVKQKVSSKIQDVLPTINSSPAETMEIDLTEEDDAESVNKSAKISVAYDDMKEMTDSNKLLSCDQFETAKGNFESETEIHQKHDHPQKIIENIIVTPMKNEFSKQDLSESASGEIVLSNIKDGETASDLTECHAEVTIAFDHSQKSKDTISHKTSEDELVRGDFSCKVSSQDLAETDIVVDSLYEVSTGEMIRETNGCLETNSVENIEAVKENVVKDALIECIEPESGVSECNELSLGSSVVEKQAKVVDFKHELTEDLEQSSEKSTHHNNSNDVFSENSCLDNANEYAATENQTIMNGCSEALFADKNEMVITEEDETCLMSTKMSSESSQENTPGTLSNINKPSHDVFSNCFDSETDSVTRKNSSPNFAASPTAPMIHQSMPYNKDRDFVSEVSIIEVSVLDSSVSPGDLKDAENKGTEYVELIQVQKPYSVEQMNKTETSHSNVSNELKTTEAVDKMTDENVVCMNTEHESVCDVDKNADENTEKLVEHKVHNQNTPSSHENINNFVNIKKEINEHLNSPQICENYDEKVVCKQKKQLKITDFSPPHKVKSSNSPAQLIGTVTWDQNNKIVKVQLPSPTAIKEYPENLKHERADSLTCESEMDAIAAESNVIPDEFIPKAENEISNLNINKGIFENSGEELVSDKKIVLLPVEKTDPSETENASAEAINSICDIDSSIENKSMKVSLENSNNLLQNTKLPNVKEESVEIQGAHTVTKSEFAVPVSLEESPINCSENVTDFASENSMDIDNSKITRELSEVNYCNDIETEIKKNEALPISVLHDGQKGAKKRKNITPARSPIANRLRARRLKEPQTVMLKKKLSKSKTAKTKVNTVHNITISTMEKMLDEVQVIANSEENAIKGNNILVDSSSEQPGGLPKDKDSKDPSFSLNDAVKSSPPILAKTLSREDLLLSKTTLNLSPFSRSHRILQAARRQNLLSSDQPSEQKSSSSPTSLLESIHANQSEDPPSMKNCDSPRSSPGHGIRGKKLSYPSSGILKRHRPNQSSQHNLMSPKMKKVRFAHPLVQARTIQKRSPVILQVLSKRKKHVRSQDIQQAVKIPDITVYEADEDINPPSNPLTSCPKILESAVSLRKILSDVVTLSQIETLEPLLDDLKVRKLSDLSKIGSNELEVLGSLTCETLVKAINYHFVEAQSSIISQVTFHEHRQLFTTEAEDDRMFGSVICCSSESCTECSLRKQIIKSSLSSVLSKDENCERIDDLPVTNDNVDQGDKVTPICNRVKEVSENMVVEDSNDKVETSCNSDSRMAVVNDVPETSEIVSAPEPDANFVPLSSGVCKKMDEEELLAAVQHISSSSSATFANIPVSLLAKCISKMSKAIEMICEK